MMQVMRNERGMALALAIVALVVVGALVAGAFFAGTQEQRVGENARFAQQAFGVAEQGVYEVIRGWNPQTMNTRRTYPLDSFQIASVSSQSGTGRYGGWVYRMNDEVYFIDMTGRDSTTLKAAAAFRRRGGGAVQRIGLLARIRPLAMDIKASLTSGGQNIVAGNAAIDGNDHTPTGWANCGTLDSAKAGIRMQDDATVSQSGHPTLLGSPPVMKDPTLADSSFSKYGDVTYAMLASRATITLAAQNFSNQIAPTTVGAACEYANTKNWGDPLDPGQPCGTYFPIIHITGNGAVINGIQGQGILLVDGGLDIQGGFQFYGIVVVKGSLKTSGGGGSQAHFWGTVMAQDTVAFSDTTNNISGSANLLYSKCAVLKALDQTGVVAMMKSRGWVQLY